jgi:WD40 repeat protein
MFIDYEYSTTKYYLIDHRVGPNGSIIEYDENWEYKNHFSPFSYPMHLISVNESIYVICLFQIIKTDRFFNIIEIFNGNQFFVDAFYNSTKKTLFVLSYIQYQIYEFDLDLNIIDSFYIRADIWSLNGYNQNIYAGGSFGVLYIIKNKVISQTIEVSNTRLSSIVFDDYGYMAISSDYNVYLYDFNGTFTNITKSSNSYYLTSIGFDPQGKFILIDGKEMKIFY